VVAIARRLDARTVVAVADGLLGGGVRAFELTLNEPPAGATFLVMPHTDAALIAWAAGRSIPCFPGALTPTEILTAWRAGATAVKLFPASVAGPAFVREFRGPFPDIPLVPTGGITVESAPAFIRAGALAVGIGSWLTGDGEPAGIARRGAQAVAAVAEARGQR
jgi:2-dehydro-3-deoxyphosphogluconate aldolase/(4S)-4-hydroxy-2-oxoglutarate aldolase